LCSFLAAFASLVGSNEAKQSLKGLARTGCGWQSILAAPIDVAKVSLEVWEATFGNMTQGTDTEFVDTLKDGVTNVLSNPKLKQRLEDLETDARLIVKDYEGALGALGRKLDRELKVSSVFSEGRSELSWSASRLTALSAETRGLPPDSSSPPQ